MMGKSDVKSIYADELREYMKKHGESHYQLVDVREPSEYTHGHIPGAKLIPLGELPQRVSELATGVDLIFYCRSGKRSRMAAFITADSDIEARNIYTVEGGILAWDGKPVEDFPRLRLFDKAANPEEILKLAMELEKGAWIFYSEILKRYPESKMAPAARSLEQLEKKHARTIFNILKKRSLTKPITGDFETFFNDLRGDILEGGEPVGDALARIEKIGHDNCLSLGELAIEIEYRAYDVYKNLYIDSTDDNVKEVYRDLSEQEKGHALVVARHIKRCTG